MHLQLKSVRNLYANVKLWRFSDNDRISEFHTELCHKNSDNMPKKDMSSNIAKNPRQPKSLRVNAHSCKHYTRTGERFDYLYIYSLDFQTNSNAIFKPTVEFHHCSRRPPPSLVVLPLRGLFFLTIILAVKPQLLNRFYQEFTFKGFL